MVSNPDFEPSLFFGSHGCGNVAGANRP
jgi:hypothetical protein